ncbi:hypothetical protein D3C73_620310 [compost metagenome]
MRADQFEQRLADQAGFTRTRNAGDRGEATQWKLGAEIVQVVTGDAFQLQPVLGLAPTCRRTDLFGEQIGARLRLLYLGQPLGRPAVENLPAVLTRRRADIDQPVGAAHGLQVVLDHEQRVARRFQTLQRLEQRFAVCRVQAGRGLIQHVDHTKQLRAQLRGQAQALQFTGRQGGRAALQCQVAEPQVGQDTDPFQQVLGDALRGQALFHRQVGCVAHVRGIGVAAGAVGHPLFTGVAGLLMSQHFARFIGCIEVAVRGHRPQDFGHLQQRHLRQLANVVTGEGHRQGLTLEPFAGTQRARAADHELRDAFLHQRALRLAEGVQDVASGAAECALVTRFHLALERDSGFLGSKPGIHRNRRGFLGEENPVALFFGQVSPGLVDVDAHGHQDVAQVLALPRQRP